MTSIPLVAAQVLLVIFAYGAEFTHFPASQVHAPEAKVNPVPHVAATLSESDVQVIVAAPVTEVQAVHAPALTHVPASQVVATLLELDVHVTVAASVTGVQVVQKLPSLNVPSGH